MDRMRWTARRVSGPRIIGPTSIYNQVMVPTRLKSRRTGDSSAVDSFRKSIRSSFQKDPITQEKLPNGSAVDSFRKSIRSSFQKDPITQEKLPNNGPGPMNMLFSGAVLSVLVVFLLAMRADDVGMEPTAIVATDIEDLTYNIVDAAFPLTAQDAVSVALGEGFAGVIGGLSSFLLSLTFSNRKDDDPNAPNNDSGSENVKVTDALADGDYFLTRAAAFPLLTAVGLPPVLVSAASVAFATVPYELIKFVSRRRSELQAENELLQDLLMQQQANTGQNNFAREIKKLKTRGEGVNPAELIPVKEKSESVIDYVEIFADICKWLEYDVLTTDFGGSLSWIGPPFVESAVLGLTASLSSQVYSDILYAFFGLGGEERRQSILSRTNSEWITIYAKRSIAALALFGVYEAAKGPAGAAVSALVSGGIEGCVGSDNFDLCVETFRADNPSGASPEAQFRALVTSLVSLWNNPPLPSPEAQFRALFTSLVSLWNRLV